MQNMPIGIFRGDDTDAFSYQTIVGTINTDLDLTGCKAVFRYLGFSMEFDPIPEDKKLTIIIPADETRQFPPGLGYASLRVYDSEGKLKTFSNRIMVFVATKTPMFGSDEFEVDFNVRAKLEPLRFFVGPNSDDFDEYRGYVEKVIDRASATKYGLAILLDAIDSDLGANDGAAATPVAVKAAYSAIIERLTDDYYTAAETDEAIDRVAAYYITYTEAGAAFPTYAALANAQTVYSGGEVRVPTRNDYCVVLADETHGGAEYRYIYAVADGETTGRWEAQFPVEGVMTVDQTVTKNSANPVSGGGIWAALWGALAALPTGFTSLYDWCVSQLAGKLDKSGGTMTGTLIARDFLSGLCTFTIGGEPVVNGRFSIPNATEEHYVTFAYKDGKFGLFTKNGASDAGTFYALQTTPGTLALLQNLAGDFDATRTAQTKYVQNELTVYNNALYRCINPNGHTGDWVPADFAVATVEDVLTALRAAVAGKLDNRQTTVDGLATLSFIAVNDEPRLRMMGAAGQRIDITFSALRFQIPGYQEFVLTLPMATGLIALTSDIPDVSGLASKAANPTAGNLAALDAQGNPTDSTIPAANVAVKNDIPYSLGTPTVIDTASSETVEGETVYYGAATLANRTANVVQVTAATALDELRITFPAATSGKVRDFGLRVEIGTGSAALAAPALVPIAPTGETIKIENNTAEIPALADGTATAKGVTLLYFSETASGVFVVKGEQVEEVA